MVHWPLGGLGREEGCWGEKKRGRREGKGGDAGVEKGGCKVIRNLGENGRKCRLKRENEGRGVREGKNVAHSRKIWNNAVFFKLFSSRTVW